MKTLCVVQAGVVIHIGHWNVTYDIEGDEGTVEVPVPLPEGAVEGEFDITQTPSGRFVLMADYVALRRDSYPSITDQLDMQFHDAADGGGRWASAIAAVKAAFPK